MTTAGCIDPQTVTPDSLLMYLDGEAPAEVSQHVAACPACAAEAASLNRLQEQLGAALFRFDCPPSQVLGEYAIDLVTPEDRTSVAQHVVDCPRCTSELRSMREFLVADDLLLPARSGVVAGLRRIVASLFPPAPALAPAVALRGTCLGHGAVLPRRRPDPHPRARAAVPVGSGLPDGAPGTRQR